MFIACWCMYDIKNPANRHPERLEFEKLLKTSGVMDKPAPPDISSDTKGLSNVSAATTVVMQQNERSIKSLDEIMDMNEVSEDLMVIKQPNGQINYVEDTKSDKSQASSSSSKDNDDSANILSTVATSKMDTSEEEKSVIAMLDDVLQTEDDGLSDSHFYDRKISVDSEMVPSVIRSTTVATVHSSSSGSSENDFTETTEDNTTPRSVDSGIGNYLEKQKIAQELVEEILNSPQLWMALETHREEQREKQSQQFETLPNDSLQANYLTSAGSEVSASPQNRAQSVESLLSLASVEDPLHSEKFRNKLSQLIMRPPEAKPIKESALNETTNSQQVRPKLKHSKSEADVRQLVLKAIEGCDIDIDGNPKLSQTNTNTIPKPPKFDPVLYKTINSLGRPKERPSLDKLLKEDEQSKPKIVVEINESEVEEMPFKQKLEAILKRGPSHRTQVKPQVELRRPRSTEPLQQHEDVDYASEHLSKSQSSLEKPRENSTKSQSNLNTIPASMINETRRTLRSVKQKPNDL